MSPVLRFRNNSDQSGLCSKVPDLRKLGGIVPFDVYFHYIDNAFISIA